MRLSNLILFLIPALIWGSTWYVIKFQIGDTDPLFSVGYRFAISGAILLVYSKLRKFNLKFSPKQHFFVALQGACLFGINYWLVYMAEEHLTSGLVAIIFSGLIFMNIFLNALFLKAPVRKNVMVGGAIGFIGIALIFKDELTTFSFSDANFVAFVMAFGSMILASAGNILSAYNQMQKVPVVQTNVFGMIYGSVIVIAIGLLSGKSFSIDMNFPYLSSLLYLSVFGSIFAFTAYLNLLGKIGPDKSGYISLVMPVIALFLSTLLEGYQWTSYGFFGLLLILAGILMALKRQKKPGPLYMDKK